LQHKQQQIAPGFIKPAPGHAWCRVRKAARAFPINVFPDDATTDQRMQLGIKPRKLARKFRNRLNDDSLILLKNGRVKLRMAERSAVESIRWRLVSTEKARTRQSRIRRNTTTSSPSDMTRRR